MGAFLHRDLRHARQQLAVLLQRAEVADDEDLRVTRHLQRRLRGHAARRDRAARRATSPAAMPPLPRPTARCAPRCVRRAPRLRAAGAGLGEAAPHDAFGIDAGDDRAGDEPRRPGARAIGGPRPGGDPGNAASRFGLPSMTTIRADSGWMLRKSCRSDCRAISASAPASSTPVAPPPTITKVRKRRCRAGSLSRSAASNASSTRRRISSASSSVLRPGARAAHSGCPK